MVERFGTVSRSLDEDFELLADLRLAHVIGEALRAQCALDGVFLRRGGRWRDDAFAGLESELVVSIMGIFPVVRAVSGRASSAPVVGHPFADQRLAERQQRRSEKESDETEDEHAAEDADDDQQQRLRSGTRSVPA